MDEALAISATGLSYGYNSGRGARVEALREVSFNVKLGEFLGVVGPSGSGKSTLLHMLSQLLMPDAGNISFPAFGKMPHVGYMFQGDATFPWRTVEGNLTYALEIRREAGAVRHRRAEELCGLVGLNPGEHLRKFPSQLSGGQVRRVGLGMALADAPDLLLLDEPSSAVDWITRRQLQRMIQDVVIKSRATAIIVTHDIEEAVWLCDRVITLQRGFITNSIDVCLPRLRTDEMRTTETFKVLEDRVIASLVGASPVDPVSRTSEFECN